MSALPLGELYDALRAHGLAIGVDDHIRIARLLERDLAWTPDTLRIAIAALVVIGPDDRQAFDACWERWLRGAEAPAASDRPPPRLVSARPQARTARAVAVAIAIAIAIAIAVVAAVMLRDGRGAPAAAPADGLAPAGAPVGVPSGAPPLQQQPGSPAAAVDLARAALVLGALVIAAAAVAGMVGARARRRFLPPPWRYALAVPPATRPVLPRTAIEDAAAELTWRTHDVGDDIDIARSVAATVLSGGFPSVVLHQATRAPRYLVLQDTAGGAACWRFLYDELIRGLVREGVELERWTFAANPELCTGDDGRSVALAELLERADAVIAIGDGAAAIDALTGERAAWLAILAEVPHRLWIDPLPPARRTLGARVIGEHMPIEHGAAGAVAALREAAARRGRPVRPYPAVIERAPESASAIEALRGALGERGFRLVAALASAGPPTIAAARWIAETHALGLDEHDWLGVAALPWFRTGRWLAGLRARLRAALAAEDPRLARAISVTSERLFVGSEPPHPSGAHLAWQLDGAVRASERGERVAAARGLNRLVRTPLGHEARRQLAALRMLDRGRIACVAAMLLGTGIIAVAGIGFVVARPAAAPIPVLPAAPPTEPAAAPAPGKPPTVARPPIVILGIEVYDTGGGIDLESLAAAKQVTAWLRLAAVTGDPFVLARDGEHQLIDEKLLESCDSEAPACMAVIGNNLGAEVLMYGRLEKVEHAGQTVYRIKLHVLDVRSQQVIRSTVEEVAPRELTPARAAAWYRKLVAQ